MSTFFRILLLSAVYVCSANAAESPLNIQAISATGINNFRAPESDVLATGQPTAEQFEVMAEQGIKHVINLRTPGEDAGFDEKAIVESLGMSYHSIPVSVGEGGINTENSQSLQSLLEQFGEEGVVVPNPFVRVEEEREYLKTVINGKPEDVANIVSNYADWLAVSDIPKLFIDADPGAILIGEQREFCRKWPNQTEIKVSGSHFIQEDSPYEIGKAVSEWLNNLK